MKTLMYPIVKIPQGVGITAQKHLFSDEQDYLYMYYITQQVSVRVSKALCHGLID
jgi:hypothetical protein